MSSLLNAHIVPAASPSESFLIVMGMVIFLLVMLALLLLTARDEIWDKQHSI